MVGQSQGAPAVDGDALSILPIVGNLNSILGQASVICSQLTSNGLYGEDGLLGQVGQLGGSSPMLQDICTSLAGGQ